LTYVFAFYKAIFQLRRIEIFLSICRALQPRLCEHAQPHRQLNSGGCGPGGRGAPSAAPAPLPTSVVRDGLRHFHDRLFSVRRHQQTGRLQNLPSAQLAASGTGDRCRQRRLPSPHNPPHPGVALVPSAEENCSRPGASAKRWPIHLPGRDRDCYHSILRARADATVLDLFQEWRIFF